MKLLLDENLSPALVGRLASSSVECVHVSRVGLIAVDDDEIWSVAAREGFVIVTKGKDIQQKAMLFGPPPQVVRLAIGNRSLAETSTVLRAHVDAIRAFVAQPERAILLIGREDAAQRHLCRHPTAAARRSDGGA